MKHATHPPVKVGAVEEDEAALWNEAVEVVEAVIIVDECC